jgi:hypothetical protein
MIDRRSLVENTQWNSALQYVWDMRQDSISAAFRPIKPKSGLSGIPKYRDFSVVP